MSRFKAAVIQDAPVVFDSHATLEKINDLTAKAAGAGTTLVVFWEAFLSAYPKGLDFGARVGMRSPGLVPRLQHLAETLLVTRNLRPL